MNNLDAIAEILRADLTEKDAARDKAVVQSRELIRLCAECIRAIHRREWDDADVRLQNIRHVSQRVVDGVAGYPELFHSGYLQDALKEVVEAFITYAIIRDQPLPTPEALAVPSSTYLLGLAEAATELRRFILDIMRLDERHSQEAERLLDCMDTIYDHLVTFDFPDALTHGLRRQTDIVRGVLERTRGDLTTSLRQQLLQDALERLEKKLTE
ncbi:MAG: haloacid dehalogenase [Phototrophicales bacterium]|nr:MAG: haloacid dehalogenase [Phototrophicales bacterium]